jgi:hypothetical protein
LALSERVGLLKVISIFAHLDGTERNTGRCISRHIFDAHLIAVGKALILLNGHLEQKGKAVRAIRGLAYFHQRDSKKQEEE